MPITFQILRNSRPFLDLVMQLEDIRAALEVALRRLREREEKLQRHLSQSPNFLKRKGMEERRRNDLRRRRGRRAPDPHT